MSQDKKLRLVRPPDAAEKRASFDVEEPPPTEAELAEADALRALLDEGREPISNSLRAAHAPPPLTEPEHDALLARALGDLGAPPTKVEQAAAEHLARELDGEATDPRSRSVGGAVVGEGSEHLQLARALRSANAPRPIDQVTHERILKRALGAETKPAARRGSTIVMVSGLFVAAAALAMFFTTTSRDASAPSEAVAQAPAATAAAGAAAREAPRSNRAEAKVAAAAPAPAAPGERHAKGANAGDEPASPGFATPPPAAADGEARPAAARPSDLAFAAAYVPSRSTDDLFDPAAQFPKTGGESARIDRIAMARASDLRQNRFAAWGVR